MIVYFYFFSPAKTAIIWYYVYVYYVCIITFRAYKSYRREVNKTVTHNRSQAHCRAEYTPYICIETVCVCGGGGGFSPYAQQNTYNVYGQRTRQTAD